MKKLLFFWLISLSAFAQNKSNPIVTISYAGQSYSATVGVPKNYYARTPSGMAAMEAAVKSGVWSLTTTDGCVIPAGTVPPKVKPICSTAPSFTVIAVNYNRTLGVKGFGSGAEYDKPGTADGVIKEGELTWTINDIPVPGSYTAVISYQSNVAIPTANFSVNNGAAQPLTLTASGGQLRTATIVLDGFVKNNNTLRMSPSGYMTTASVQLTKTGSQTVTTGNGNCDLNLTVNNASATCNQNATLTAVATGTAATGLQYSWTGPNNFTASGASIAVAQAQNGSYQYAVTASKSGCSRSATSTVTVSGCTSTTVSDPTFSFAVPSSPSPFSYYSNEVRGFQNLPIGNVSLLENQYLRVEIRMGFGGLIQVQDKPTGKWLINAPDLGRGTGASSYTQQKWTDNANYVDENGNHPFSSNGPAPAPGPWFTGYNPLMNGDFAGHPSTNLFHGKVTTGGFEWIYDKQQLNSWSHDNNRMMPVIAEQWVRLEANKVHVKTRLTHDRTDDLTDFETAFQEWRLMMVNGRKKAVFYNGQQPYTNATPTYSDGIERIEPNGTYIKPSRPFPVSEPWLGVTINDNDTRMIAHYAPDMYWPSYISMDPHEGGDCDGCRTAVYTSGHQMAKFDPKGVWLFHDTYIVGTLAEVREYVYAQPRPTPNWVFNQATQRNGWSSMNGVFDGQLPNAANNANGWVMNWLGKADGSGPRNIDNTFIISPRTSFKASDCPTLYIKGKLNNTTQTAWKIKYSYVGQERESLNNDHPNENNKRFPYSPKLASANTPVNFTMTNNGTLQTYAIPMNWNSNSYISTVELWPNGSNMQTEPHFEILSIGCTNPN